MTPAAQNGIQTICTAKITNPAAPNNTTSSTAIRLIHGYYAAVSFIDDMLGRVLDGLENEGLADNTIVVLMGDHGWQLGEHGLWCKHCNFHNVLQTPLLISVPWLGKSIKQMYWQNW